MRTAHWFGLVALSITAALAGCSSGTPEDRKATAKNEQGQLVTVSVPGMT